MMVGDPNRGRYQEHLGFLRLESPWKLPTNEFWAGTRGVKNG